MNSGTKDYLFMMDYIMTTFQPFVEVVIVQALQHEHYCAGCVKLHKQKNKFYDLYYNQNITSLRNSNIEISVTVGIIPHR